MAFWSLEPRAPLSGSAHAAGHDVSVYPVQTAAGVYPGAGRAQGGGPPCGPGGVPSGIYMAGVPLLPPGRPRPPGRAPLGSGRRGRLAAILKGRGPVWPRARPRQPDSPRVQNPFNTRGLSGWAGTARKRAIQALSQSLKKAPTLPRRPLPGPARGVISQPEVLAPRALPVGTFRSAGRADRAESRKFSRPGRRKAGICRSRPYGIDS